MDETSQDQSTSQVLIRATAAARKYRLCGLYESVIKTITEAEAIVTRDRMSIVAAVEASATCSEAIDRLSELMAL